MTELGAKGEGVQGQAYVVRPRPYTGETGRKRFKRIGLGIFLSALAACVGVSLLGAVGNAFIAMFGNLLGLPSLQNIGNGGFGEGISMAIQLATFNFIVFFITVPAAAIALGLSIGRLPYRGIYQRISYLRWGAIWGAILVGVTTFGFGWFGGALTALGSLIAGALIGAVAGLGCGFLFHAIVRPVEQAEGIDVNVF